MEKDANKILDIIEQGGYEYQRQKAYLIYMLRQMFMDQQIEIEDIKEWHKLILRRKDASIESLSEETKELKDKVNHYKNKFYTTHQSAEVIKNDIRNFFNILSLKGLLQNVDYGSNPVKKVFNKITQYLERLETLENENQELQETIGETHYKMVRSIKAIKLLKCLNAIAPLEETTYTSAVNGEDLITIYTINGSYLSKEQYKLIEEVLKWAN